MKCLPDHSTGKIPLLQAIDLPPGDRARGRAGEGGVGSTGIALTWSISQIGSGRLRQGAGGPPGKQPPRAHVLLLTILPGLKGVHIHNVGRCVPPFDPARPHFNPAKAVRAVMSCARPEGPYDVLATLRQLFAYVQHRNGILFRPRDTSSGRGRCTMAGPSTVQQT